MRFTIERIRTMVLLAAALLLAALALFLFTAKWKSRFRRMDLPRHLAREIQQESRNFDYTHNFGAHSKFRIHASKAIQLKNDRIDLHGVKIDLYGPNGTEADSIKGDEFVYDEKSGVTTATGPVEMLLTRPAPHTSGGKLSTHSRAGERLSRASGQIEVTSSGVSFDRNSGMVTTSQRVDFAMAQGSGSAAGATFDSESGHLTLLRAVELTTYRGEDEVRIHAQHAEFDRGTQLCVLLLARLGYRDGQADAGQARIKFRDDGSAERLDATDGFALTTATGGRLTSPTAVMDFDQHNQPRKGHLEGGVKIDSAQVGRNIHGTSPTAELDFTAQGQLRHAHLERGVVFESDETGTEISGQSRQARRTWRSSVADLDFRTIETAGRTQTQLETIHGAGGVVLTSESRRDAGAVPAKMQADDVTATFGPGSILRTIVGSGHAAMEQTTATGALETASGDRLEATFADRAASAGNNPASEQAGKKAGAKSGAQTTGVQDVQSAELDGHVVLFEQPAIKSGAQPPPPLRATAGKAVYEGDGEWLHLTAGPGIANGGLDLSADKVDLSRQSGNAYAHGNVKATWAGNAPDHGRSQSRTPQGVVALGGNGPAHVVASEAQLNQSTGEAVFRGHARLWQQANSVSAPKIVLNQHLQTLTASTADAADPVRAVILSAGTPGAETARAKKSTAEAAKTAAPSVIRIRGGELTYSGAEHRATVLGGVAGAVVAETGMATSKSDTVDLRMIPAAGASSGQAQSAGGQSQVDRMTATGHVVLTLQGRRGTGEQLVYSGITGDYLLTGTAAAPPRIADPTQGTVTGGALIFHSRDDSVSIEGGGHETRTDTTAPDAHAR